MWANANNSLLGSDHEAYIPFTCCYGQVSPKDTVLQVKEKLCVSMQATHRAKNGNEELRVHPANMNLYDEGIVIMERKTMSGLGIGPGHAIACDVRSLDQ